MAISRESEHPGASIFKRLASIKKRGENPIWIRRSSRRGGWREAFVGGVSSGSYSSLRASRIVFIELLKILFLNLAFE